MEPPEILWIVALLLGAVQGLFLALVLAARKASRQGPSLILVWLVVLFALMLCEEIVETSGLQRQWPHTALAAFTFSLAIGPLLLLYARRITEPLRHLRIRDLAHFLPLVVVAFHLLPFYLLGGQEKLLALERGLGPSIDPLVLLKGVHLVAYQVLAIHATGRLLDQADPTTRPHLKWFRRLLLATLAPVIYIHVVYFYPDLAVVAGADSDRIGGLILAAVIYAFAVASIRRPFFWGAHRDHEPRGPKYSTSPLDPSSESSCLEALRRLMERDHLYRDPEIRLADVAAALAVSPHVLSQTLNELAGKKFYAFLNEYRVGAVKEMMRDTDHDHRNLLALAFDAGFNSKSSFNRVFRESTGATPSVYRRQLEADRRLFHASASAD